MPLVWLLSLQLSQCSERHWLKLIDTSGVVA